MTEAAAAARAVEKVRVHVHNGLDVDWPMRGAGVSSHVVPSLALEEAQALVKWIDIHDDAPLDPEVVSLLHHLDGHLGLAVHRGEGGQDEWIKDATALIGRIREALKS